jgi:Domain of unknown function (DUF5011)
MSSDSHPKIVAQASTNKAIHSEAWVLLRQCLWFLLVAGSLIAIGCRDRAAPVIRLQGEDTLFLSVGFPFAEPGYLAFDQNDFDITDRVVVSGELDVDRPGQYERLYTVSDKAGNTAQTKRIVVMKVDANSLVGTYRSIHNIPGCLSPGISTVSISSSSNLGSRLFLRPSVGQNPNDGSVLRFNISDDSQMSSFTMTFPCQQSLQNASGLISGNADTITVNLLLRSTDNNSVITFCTVKYVKL